MFIPALEASDGHTIASCEVFNFTSILRMMVHETIYGVKYT